MAVRMVKGSAKVDSSKPGYGLTEADFDITYEGAVLGEYERNGYDDSDFFAVVWDEDAGAIVSRMWGTTRGWTYANGCTIDATEEVQEKARAWLIERDAQSAIAAAAEKAVLPERGKRVRVVKGRKVPIGTEGEVFWQGIDRYKSSKWATYYRVGFKTDDGEKHFTAEDNVEVVDAAQYLTETAEEIRERVAARVRQHATGNWASAFRSFGGALDLSRVGRMHDRDEQAKAVAEGLTGVAA